MTEPASLSPEGIERGLREQGFVATGELATTLFLAERLVRPLLLEAPPGVGKTEIGKRWARFHEAELIRLQCYEGLDEARDLRGLARGVAELLRRL